MKLDGQGRVNEQPIDAPIDTLRGVGPKLSARLNGLQLNNIQDLLFHLPLRYQDRTRVTPIARLAPGTEAVIDGTVTSCTIANGRRRSLRCVMADDSGQITLRLFHFTMAQKAQLAEGSHLRCYGQARRASGGLEIYHPEIQRSGATDASDTLTPIYPSCEGMTQNQWRKLIEQALARMEDELIPDLLPEGRDICSIELGPALRYLHLPPSDADQRQLTTGTHPVMQRLALEELTAHNLALQQMRRLTQQYQAPAVKWHEQSAARLLDSLAFAPTDAQLRVCSDIREDLAQTRPMLRLVQGDVGSGKTLVAAIAALQAAANGYQVAVMAPTELLSQQHMLTFSEWLAPLGINIAWLTGRLKGQAREQQLSALRDGSAHIAIGTHALFQEDINFHRLGLVIIDEQHRFGVHQRLQLRDKGRQGDQLPHQLVMTATPIPRTLAMTAYADLDCSIIDQLPPGRRPVKTVALSNTRRSEVIERVRLACERGEQVYWVCTLIEESEVLQARAAEASTDELREVLSGITIGLVHGRQSADEKAQTMADFKRGDLQLLVATTVIEVGVDVPNASLIIMENPERLGLAQLHQLRGRVGRGDRQSHCVLLYQPPLSSNGKARLQVMRDSNDGFVIAERDLQLRGPGDILGTRQTGLLNLRIADLGRDEHLIEPARQVARTIARTDPERSEALTSRWVGSGTLYGQI